MIITEEKILVFTHIPKTAGITLHTIIERQYRNVKSFTAVHTVDLERYQSLTLKQKQKIKIIKGHLYFGVDKYCPYPAQYYTMFRRPIERSISEYNYRVLTETEMKVHKYTLKQFLEKGITPHMDNCQVRYLCGVTDIPYGAVNEAHLQMAIHNLKTRFPVIGITESFDASVLLLAKQLHWSTPFYIKNNVTPVRVQDLKIDKETRVLLEYYNRHDEVLYDTALEIFNTQLQLAGPDFKNEVTTFTEKNAKRKFKNKIENYFGYLLLLASPYNIKNLFYDLLKHFKIRLWYIYKRIW